MGLGSALTAGPGCFFSAVGSHEAVVSASALPRVFACARMALFFPRGQRKQICEFAGGIGAPAWSLMAQETCWARLRYPVAAGG